MSAGLLPSALSRTAGTGSTVSVLPFEVLSTLGALLSALRFAVQILDLVRLARTGGSLILSCLSGLSAAGLSFAGAATVLRS